MPPETAFAKFVALIAAIEAGQTARSENDLSARLATALERDIGLKTVVDSAQRPNSRRPDILAYRGELDADLVLPAEIVIEAKKPSEFQRYSDLRSDLAQELWEDKTFPYIVANLSRIRYFILTTFVHFAILPITSNLRERFRAAAHSLDRNTITELQALVRSQVELFSLAGVTKPSDSQAQALLSWMRQHLHPDSLESLPLSSIRLAIPVSTTDELELFARRLAEIAAGVGGTATAAAGIFGSVRDRLPRTYESLDGETKRDLHLFVMAQRAAVDLSTVAQVIREDPDRWLDDFIGASIHSLISRLFALKAIEDAYCIGRPNPLIERRDWVVNTDEYDKCEPEQLVKAVSVRIRNLKNSTNFVVQGLAVFGAFFDWIVDYVDPVLFRTLMELFVVHDFSAIEEDVLGRFFEIYAQTINATKRRALGQYYTPLPIVRFMWYLAASRAAELTSPHQLTVLDPGM